MRPFVIGVPLILAGVMCMVTMVTSGGGWAGVFQRYIHHPVAFHHQPVPIFHNRVVPLPYPFYIPYPVKLGRRATDTIIVINSSSKNSRRKRKNLIGNKVHHQYIAGQDKDVSSSAEADINIDRGSVW